MNDETERFSNKRKGHPIEAINPWSNTTIQPTKITKMEFSDYQFTSVNKWDKKT